jgi:hypothetical protein
MTNTMISSELIATTKHSDGFEFRATVETGLAGLCRLNVSRHREDDDTVDGGQGIDLTPAECRALAQMLLGVTAILEADAASD